MNQVVIAGLLTGEPKPERTKSGRFHYWFSLKISDNTDGKPEVVEVVGMSECAKVLKKAAIQGQQVIVHGAIHTCDGTNLEVPGKHRFVKADEIAPFVEPLAENIAPGDTPAEDKF